MKKEIKKKQPAKLGNEELLVIRGGVDVGGTATYALGCEKDKYGVEVPITKCDNAS